MKSNTTSSQPDAKAMVTEAWEAVGASFEHFCLTAGVASLARMLEEDAAVLCGDRHERSDTRAGYRWGRTKGKIGFHGGRIEVERPRVRRRSGVEVSLPSWETALAEDWLGIQISANFFGGGRKAAYAQYEHVLDPTAVRNLLAGAVAPLPSYH